MVISNRNKVVFLFVGDVFFIVFSLYIALLIRAGQFPTGVLFQEYVRALSVLTVVWIVDFYIAGLYDKPTLILRSKLPSIILKTQIVNSIFAALLFYFIPIFLITPKTVLLIYLAVSSITILFWRVYGGQFLSGSTRQPALLIGDGAETTVLFNEVNEDNRYSVRFVSLIRTGEAGETELLETIRRVVGANDIKIIAVDFGSDKVDPLVPHLYDLLFYGVRFIDAHDIYEDAFDRVPLSLVNHSWFLKNISGSQSVTYDVLKRTMDIVIALCLGTISLVLFPFLYVAIKLDDGWKIFISQERIGQNNKPIRIIKYRSMSIDDGGAGSADRESKVTRIGKFLRASRIDELPQLWNVLLGDLSLIGPRPELPGLVSLYEEGIPFYGVRHLIKPGLSGWAQLYDTAPPKYGTDYDRTKSKLAYDLYYVKNRSFLLDLHIALKTVKDLLSRRGI